MFKTFHNFHRFLSSSSPTPHSETHICFLRHSSLVATKVVGLRSILCKVTPDPVTYKTNKHFIFSPLQMTLDNTKEDEEDGGVLEEISEDDKEEKYDKVDRDDKDDKGDDREDYGDDDEDGVVLATAEKY